MRIKNLFENVLKGPTERESLFRFLQNDTMFVGLTRKEAISLEQVLHCRQYRKDEVIFKEGEVGSAMYIILSGTVDVSSNNKTIIRLKRGDFFGEMALFDDYIRTATIQSVEDGTRLLVFSKGDLDDLISRDPTMSNKIIIRISQVLAKRLKRMTEGSNTNPDKGNVDVSEVLDIQDERRINA